QISKECELNRVEASGWWGRRLGRGVGRCAAGHRRVNEGIAVSGKLYRGEGADRAPQGSEGGHRADGGGAVGCGAGDGVAHALGVAVEPGATLGMVQDSLVAVDP